MDFNILDYGANKDLPNNSLFIQKAIDDCYKHNGGRVVIPSGFTFYTGSIVLKSNVELHLENNSCLKASENIKDFNLFNKKINYDEKLLVPSYEDCEYNGMPYLFLVYAKDEINISITGQGKIDGNEHIFYGKQDQYQIDGRFYPRMPLVFLENITNLIVKDVTLQNSAFWTLHMLGCKDVEINSIKILNNLKMVNCDGIDPDHCQNVRISNCYIHTCDDAIVFKNTQSGIKYGDCKNICVSNCNLVTTSGAIKFGSESWNDFKNIIVTNCNIFDSNRGITIQLRDKGNIENCIFSNINLDTRIFSKTQYWGASEIICITAIKRFENTNVGHIKNLTFSNINGSSENGIMIYGEPTYSTSNISDIYFDNINLKISNKSKWPKNIKDIRPTYHDNLIKDKLNVLYIINSSNIEFNRLKYEIDDNIKNELGDIFSLINSTNIQINRKEYK